MEYLLDASALTAYFADEKEADKVARIIEKSALPFVVLSEIYYISWKKRGEAEADKVYATIKNCGLPILLSDERIILMAARFKTIFKLGLSDSYIAAFAFDKNLTLVTKDEDFDIVRNEIKILFLHK